MRNFTIKKMRFLAIAFAIAVFSVLTSNLYAQVNIKTVSPELTVSVTSLSDLTYSGYRPSTQLVFTVTGTNLADNIVVSSKANFKVSLTSGYGFLYSKTLTQNGGLVPVTTIYVHLKEAQNVGIYNEDITISSTGATSKIVACSGSVISANPNLHFATSIVNKTIGEDPFTELGISDGTSAIGYSSSDPTVANVNPTTGEVTIVKTGFTAITASQAAGRGFSAATASYDLNVVSGPVLIVSPSSLNDFIYGAGAGPSAEKSFTVRGSLLTSNLIVTSSANYEISTTSGNLFEAINPIELTPVDGVVAERVIYARLKAGMIVNNYSGDITITSAGATSKNIICSGSVTCANSNIHFDVVTVNKTIGDAAFTQIAYSANTAPILYSSSQEAVAMVDAMTGEVSYTGFGSAIITASQEVGEGYCAKSASYTLIRTDTSTGLNELVVPLKVWVKYGVIYFSASSGENVVVYNTVGQKLLSRTSVEGLNSISLGQHGVVFVKVGNHITKVIQ